MLERPRGATAHLPLPGRGRASLEEAVAAFWRHHSRRRAPLRSSVARLAELALASDPRISAEGTRVLFERIVEPLCDGFTQRGADTYRRLFAQVIQIARRKASCGALDEALHTAGLKGARDLLRMPSPDRPSAADRARTRCVIVLSRLTLGADIAICMPVLRHVEAAFPNAEVAFLGGDAAGVVAQSFSRVRHVGVPYGRSDFLADRLNAWPALLTAVRRITSSFPSGEVVLIDPDSRLTQLGLLRPFDDGAYFHFPSRQYSVHATEPLSVLVCRWLHETFGPVPDGACRPRIADHEAAWARAVKAQRADFGPLVALHFGVGGDQRKRAGIEFETELVDGLAQRGCRLLLARGTSSAEIDESYRLCRRLAERGIAVTHLPPGCQLNDLPGRKADIVTWEAGVDAFLAAIASADAYVGYDSAGQHIAAALGVPTLSLFVEACGRRHALRWAPRGPGRLEIVRSPWPPDRRALLARAMEGFDRLSRSIAAPERRRVLGYARR